MVMQGAGWLAPTSMNVLAQITVLGVVHQRARTMLAATHVPVKVVSVGMGSVVWTLTNAVRT